MSPKLKTLHVDLGDKSYPIYIGAGLLSDKSYLDKHIHGKQVMIVTNTTVAPLYLQSVCELLDDYQVEITILPDGEQYKTLETVNTIFDALLGAKFDRSATLIALGGGVVGDMTGFAAASYQRGVNFIQIPTTLLSQVDSSVGGKTGVNHDLGKNMIGAFHQPKAVVIDINTLDTLEQREFSAGMAEVIKYGLLGNADFLQDLEANMSDLMNRDVPLIIDAVYRSCEDKARIVAEDEFEAGNRALLNLGHTFGHGIENTLGYGTYLHGEAVSVGMLMAAKLSELEGDLTATCVERVVQLLNQANLPCEINKEITEAQLFAAMSLDKKAIDGNIRLVLLRGLGDAYLSQDYSEDNLNQVVRDFIS
ncbi:MAG TPA: 3-dehydroquinate synthase [Candidatus Thioglobus sp.]|nr:3-dehydroquinate synthase [Candidatus Thioglobus sp.]HIL20558.1 3-dehydroquinate synthase [Candidatus Thioglobus sp.]